ncbi:DUF1360 domain-containing protein [Sutcliffiella sp. NPDC057660]|uniref:DUF1360 domain-containing protein n=1 Tax=Sutcliffiella sp. NPDC057660 TaxID=3346199 RepID=UPI0036B896FE
MLDEWYWFLLLGLASFRLTRLIITDKITNFLRKPFIEEVEEVNGNGETETYVLIKGKGLRGFFGELLSCHWCTGMWVTAGLFFLFYLYPLAGKPMLVILAAAGLAGIIESIINRIID